MAEMAPYQYLKITFHEKILFYLFLTCKVANHLTVGNECMNMGDRFIMDQGPYNMIISTVSSADILQQQPAGTVCLIS